MDPKDSPSQVDGYESPPSDDLISLIAAKAGKTLSVLKTATKGALSSIPLVGKNIESRMIELQEQVDVITIHGRAPTTVADWQIVLQALQTDQMIHTFHFETLQPLRQREAWPIDSFYVKDCKRRRFSSEPAAIFQKLARCKDLCYELGLEKQVESTLECQRLDQQRTSITAKLELLSQELVNATVVCQLSKSFTADAKSALIKFAQISSKAKFSSSSTQQNKLTARQRRKRQDYLDAFEQCVRYIPCWILTSPMVSDYLPAQSCLFDLVILDEASQSDCAVLPALMRAKQWLIVGDGKQVSPTEGFVAEEHIDLLKQSLPQSPMSASLLPGQSFFDLCSQAYPNGRILLKEHFRCAPELIAYSNAEYYDNSLIPLRLPKSNERMTPSLVDVYIKGGTKQGKVNHQECDEIVKRIQEYVNSCSHSADNMKKSIGVISLLGDEQSRLIRGRLLDAIGPKAMKEHNLLIGDPPTFQGAERDIVFLCMVCSPGQVPSQTQLMHAQRANVALSRARDQMILVRSIQLKHISNPQDMKCSILEFFQQAGNGDNNENGETSSSSSGGPTSRHALSPVRADAEQLLQHHLTQLGYETSSMGIVWYDAICVESSSSTSLSESSTSTERAAICVQCSGETLDEWKHLVEQQKSIERVGWKCLRVDALSLLYDFYATVEHVLEFLTLAGVMPSVVEVAGATRNRNQNEDDDSDTSSTKQDQAEEEAKEEEGNVNVLDAAVPEEQEDDDDVVMISSDDDDDEDDRKPAAKNQNHTVKEEEEEGDDALLQLFDGEERDTDYGQAVDLGFLGIMPPGQSQQPRRLAPVARRRRHPDTESDDDDDNSSSSGDDDKDETEQGRGRTRRTSAAARKSKHLPPAKRRKRRSTSRDDREGQKKKPGDEKSGHKKGYARGVARARNDNTGYGGSDDDDDDDDLDDTSLSSDQDDRYLGRSRSKSQSQEVDSGDESYAPEEDKEEADSSGSSVDDGEDKKPKAKPSQKVRASAKEKVPNKKKGDNDSSDESSKYDDDPPTKKGNGKRSTPSDLQSKSSRASSKRRRLDKYSRDARWYPSRRSKSDRALETKDEDYDEYMGSVAPEKLPPPNNEKESKDSTDVNVKQEAQEAEAIVEEQNDVKPPVETIIEIDQDEDDQMKKK